MLGSRVISKSQEVETESGPWWEAEVVISG